MLVSLCGFFSFEQRKNFRILRDFSRNARRADHDIATLRPMAQGVVDQHQRQHGLGNRRRPNADAGIVPPFGGYLDCIAANVDRGADGAIDEVGLIAMLTTIS